MTVSVTVAERIACASRSCGSLVIISAKPWPSPPSMFAAGTRTSSKNSSDVSCAFMPSFSRLRPRVKPGRFDSTRNSVTPLAPALGIGLGRQHDDVAELAVGDEDLLAVDDEIVAVATRLRAHRLEIAAGVRLGHAERADRLAPHHLRQPMALLLLGAERKDVGGDEIGMDEKARPARADAPKLLEHDDVEQIIEAEAAVFLRHRAAQQALFARPSTKARAGRCRRSSHFA